MYILHLLKKKKKRQIFLLFCIRIHHLIEVKGYKIILSDFSSAFLSPVVFDLPSKGINALKQNKNKQMKKR